MKRKFSGFLVGMVLCGAIFGSAGGYAASRGSLIEVFYNVNDIVINRVSKMPKDNKSFTYNGSTYVPLRFIAENLGQSIDWNGNTGTIYIGETAEQTAVYPGKDIKHMNRQSEESYNTWFDEKYDSNTKIKDNIENEYDSFIELGLNSLLW